MTILIREKGFPIMRVFAFLTPGLICLLSLNVFPSIQQKKSRQTPVKPDCQMISPNLPQILQGFILNGRRFLRGIPYILPKDSPELNRLNFQHFYLHILLGAHYAAPLPKERIGRILDVGTGTGKWVYDIAKAMPHARIFGVDIELPTLPSWEISTNYQFVQANILQGLPFPNHEFSFVHQRLMVAAIPAQQWPFVVQELVRVTCPGGFVELCEAGEEFLHEGPALRQILTWCRAAARKRGFDAAQMCHLGDLLHQAGLVDVQERILQAPIGKWAGWPGEALATNLSAIFNGLKSFCCTQLSLPSVQFETTLAALPQEWEQYHTVFHFYVVYGRKRKR